MYAGKERERSWILCQTTVEEESKEEEKIERERWVPNKRQRVTRLLETKNPRIKLNIFE